VGNTVTGCGLSAKEAVHPHMRGEHIGGIPGFDGDFRFIPTCVGNTS